MFRKGLGMASNYNSHRIGEVAARRALRQCPEPDIALVLVSSFLEAEEVLAGIRSILGKVPL